ncbi:MAG: rRNA synthase [Solirubrobacteraceae bacterium]|nr:rRNA synthase [Solirubrobacteraceae bacterium]
MSAGRPSGAGGGGASMRLAKHLAHAGVASRRAAEAMIAAGRVTVDGERVTDPARGVTGAEAITVDGRRLGAPPEHVVYAVHKPMGVVSTARDPQRRAKVVDLVPNAGTRLYPVGRLDADATGLILLTNDGALANQLTHPRYEVPKTYRVRVANSPVREPALRKLRDGIDLEDGRTAPAQVRHVRAAEIELTIHEGRNHQVRRMCEAVGHPVLSLQRVAFGRLRLGDLPEGGHRRLTAAEVERLYGAAARPEG